MKLKCINCQYTKDVMEQELMSNTECEICGGSMMFEESANYLIDEKKKEEIQNEQEGLNEVLDKQLLSTMINEIKQFGEDKVWKAINSSDIEIRLNVMPIFIEAKKQIEKGEYYEKE